MSTPEIVSAEIVPAEVGEVPEVTADGTAPDTTPETAVPEATLTLPMSRIKKILKLDPEHISSTESANYLIGAATELFIMNLTEKASFNAKTQKRKKVLYSDFHQVVTSNDSLLFMKDLVPKTAPLQQLVEEKKVKLAHKPKEIVGTGAGASTNDDDTIDDAAAESVPTPAKTNGGQQILPFFQQTVRDKPQTDKDGDVILLE